LYLSFLRNLALPEAAHHDAFAIRDVADRLVCIAHDLVHDQLLPEASPSSELGILSQSTLRFLQVMCALKLFRKLARVEILTNVSQPLFQFEESFLDVLLVGEGDVAPHRVRTRRDACHFAQGTSSGRQQWSV